MNYMFSNCLSLKELDLTSFNTTTVTNMSYMFNRNTSLNLIKFGNNFNTSNVTNMCFMFSNCTSIQYLDLSNFDISNVSNINYMFYCMYSIRTLDISNFIFTNISLYNALFSNYALHVNDSPQIIYVKDSVSQEFINARLTEANKTGISVEIKA